MTITIDTLTDEQIAGVERTAIGRLYLDCLDATTAEPFDPDKRDRWLKIRLAARQRICDAINGGQK